MSSKVGNFEPISDHDIHVTSLSIDSGTLFVVSLD